MLNTFQVAVRNNNANTMRNLIHFPLPTGIAQQDIGNGAPTNPIDQREFKKYYPSIFHEKAIKLLDNRKYNDIHKVGLAKGNTMQACKKPQIDVAKCMSFTSNMQRTIPNPNLISALSSAKSPDSIRW